MLTNARSTVRGAALMLSIVYAPELRSETISFELSDLQLSASIGETVTFNGTVTNETGAGLNANDLFFIFFGFDPATITVSQELGMKSNFLIPNGSTSASVPLFSARVGIAPGGSILPIEAQLGDTNFDFSLPQTVFINVNSGSQPPPPTNVPEPSPLAFGVFCMVVAAATRRWASSRIS